MSNRFSRRARLALIATGLLAIGAGTARADSESWPIEIIDRPLTLPGGSVSAGLALDANRDFTAIGGAATGLWGVSVGVTDDLSVGLGYALGLREPEGRGPFDLSVGYSVYGAGPLTVAATAGYSHDFMTGTDGASTGALLWLMLGEQLALVSPGDQLAVGFDDSSASLSLPVGLGFQPTSKVYLQLDVNLIDIGISNAETAAPIADQLPIGFSGFFSPVRQLDLGASVAVDPVVGSDALSFGVVAVYYGGV